MFRVIALMILMFSAGSYSAEQSLVKHLDEINAFPIAQQVDRSNDMPVTTIDTGMIRDPNGQLARGPHDVVFTLSSNAAFAVYVEGHKVEPGHTHSMVVNLTSVNHRLILPIYPASNNTTGTVNFELNIPFLNVKVCPEGFQERPGDCYRIEFSEINYICPSDFNFSNSLNDCRRTHSFPLANTCPSGYTQAGDTCTNLLTTDVTFECPSDFYFYGNDCVRKTYESSLVCEVGFDYNSNTGRCQKQVDTYQAQSPCPQGYSSSGDQCIRELSQQPAELLCPDSHSNIDAELNKCFTIQEAPIGHEPLSSENDCWLGYQWLNSQCVEFLEPSLECPNDMQLKDGSCLKLEAIPAGNYCGDTMSLTTECAVYELSDTGAYCSSGYIYQSGDNNCLKIDTAPATRLCVDGYSLSADNLTCERTDLIELEISCPAGMVRSDDGEFCYEEYSQPAVQECPEGAGWTKDGTQCNYFDSDEVSSCPAGYTLRDGSCHRLEVKSQLCSAGYINQGDGTCSRHETQDATPTCGTGYTYNSSTSRCERTDTIDANPVCGSGYTYSATNSRCEKQENQSATPTCPSGYSYSSGNQRCERVDTQAATPTCPSGSVYDNRLKKCYTTEQYSATKICGSGYTLSQNNSCVKTTTTSTTTTYSCSEGELNGTNCLVRAEPTMSCPSTTAQQCGPMSRPFLDRESNNTCYYKDIEHCGYSWEVTEQKRPSCPWGSTFKNGKCETTQPATASQSCPSGYSLEGGQCIKREYQQPTMSCSKPNSTYTGNGMCTAEKHSSNGWSCPSGWSRSESQCSRTLTEANGWSCPSGWSRDGSNCSRVVTQPNTWSCPSGSPSYSLEGSQCSRLLTQSNGWSCSNGWNNHNNGYCHRELTEDVHYYCGSGRSEHSTSHCFINSPDYNVGSCPSNYVLNSSNGNCEHIDAQEVYYICPAGSNWTNRPPSCDYYKESALELECPSNYEFNGSQSTCDRLSIESATRECPDGFALDLSNERCFRETVIPHL